MAIDNLEDDKATNKYDNVVLEGDHADDQSILLKALTDKIDEIVVVANKGEHSSNVALTTLDKIGYSLEMDSKTKVFSLNITVTKTAGSKTTTAKGTIALK